MKKFLIIMCLCCAVALDAMQAHAATARIVDSSQMNLSAINAVQGTSVVQVGTVIIWGATANPHDADKWLECNGQSTAGYPELADVVGANVPNYTNQFLRGGIASQVGQTVADSIRGHDHGYIASNTEKSLSYVASVTGGAGGSGGEIWNCFVQVQEGCGHTYGGYSYVAVTDETGKDIRTGCMDVTLYPRCTSAGGVSGGSSSVESVIGSSIVSGALANKTTSSYGGAETAPQHIRVRYLIRALP